MLVKLLLVAHCVSVFCPVIADNSASIPPLIFDNYKKGASQFVAIIDYLLAGVGTTEPVTWAQQLQNNVQALPVSFQASLTESEHQKAKLDQSTIDLVTQSSQIEAQIVHITSDINANQALVSSYENQVSLATQHVQNAENSLASTERALRDLEEKLRKTRDECWGRRRRKRSWWTDIRDTITRPFKEIGKGICRLIGEITGSIDRAKDRRNDARGVRDNAVNVLNTRKNELDAARQKLASSKNELATKQSQLAGINQQLSGLRAEIVAIGVVNQGLKSVIEHIDRILVGSSVLKRFVEDLSLLDLNTLIEPLERIGRELMNNIPGTEMVHFPALSQDQITSIRNNLKTLSEQLPNEEVISNEGNKFV